MIAGADVDARTYLLPDTITWGAVGFGIAAAPAYLRGQRIEMAMKLPFGAFLCPALWLVFLCKCGTRVIEIVRAALIVRNPRRRSFVMPLNFANDVGAHLRTRW
jgi:hypothetical protein